MSESIHLVAPANGLRLAVGIDVARYGHHATLLKLDAQSGLIDEAAPKFRFEESRSGFNKLATALERLHQRYPQTTLNVRLDVAGQYGANLVHFLRALPLPLEISIGNPARNKSYREALLSAAKSDPAESYTMARFALVERPAPAQFPTSAMTDMRELAARLLAITRRQTHHANQLHNLLARVFPELVQLVANLRAPSILTLLKRYPTPQHLLRAQPQALAKLPHLKAESLVAILHAARNTVGSYCGPIAAALVQQLAGDLLADCREKRRTRKLLVDAYQVLPNPNHLDTIPSIGIVTAAAITAKVGDIQRFPSARKLVNYFGVFPERDKSGVHPDGTAKESKALHMSRRGNDLVRAYLYNCARTAARHHPGCKALYARHRRHGVNANVALGHVMAKLLRIAHAIWVSGKPYDAAKAEKAAQESEAAATKHAQRRQTKNAAGPKPN